jgi:hypothetical protein
MTKNILPVWFLMVLCAFYAAAQTRPSYTGTWNLNLQKSKFAGQTPVVVTIEFKHKGNDLTEIFTSSQSGAEHTIEARYTIDGKESDVPVGDEVIKATTKWEGDSLVINWKGPETGRYFNRKLKISADGLSMIIILKRSRPDGRMAEETWVLEKQ